MKLANIAFKLGRIAIYSMKKHHINYYCWSHIYYCYPTIMDKVSQLYMFIDHLQSVVCTFSISCPLVLELPCRPAQFHVKTVPWTNYTSSVSHEVSIFCTLTVKTFPNATGTTGKAGKTRRCRMREENDSGSEIPQIHTHLVRPALSCLQPQCCQPQSGQLELLLEKEFTKVGLFLILPRWLFANRFLGEIFQDGCDS